MRNEGDSNKEREDRLKGLWERRYLYFISDG